MKQKLYYIKNETAEKAIYKNLEKQRFSVIEKTADLQWYYRFPIIKM